MYGRVEVQLYTFLKVAIDAGEWTLHTLSTSSPWKDQFVPIGNKVNTRVSLDGAEKRKISAYASTRTHSPCHPVWHLDNTSSE